MLVVDLIDTGKNIKNIMLKKGYKVRDLQNLFRFTTPMAIYKWINGKCLPTVDNLVILADIFDVTINDLLVVKNV